MPVSDSVNQFTWNSGVAGDEKKTGGYQNRRLYDAHTR